MRPAIEVARAVRAAMRWQEDADAIALIQRDREALVREICEMIEREFDAPHLIDCVCRISDEIERKFLKGAASDE